MNVGVNVERSILFGKIIFNIINKIKIDKFIDKRYYPDPKANRREVTQYFIVMVALDHRLSRPRRPYEGIVDGEFYHGADLLYRLGRKILETNPEFFEANNLSKITIKDIRKYFSAKKPTGTGIVEPPDPHIRAKLLRDLGEKIKLLYEGDPYNIIIQSRGYLRKNVGEGFIDRLKIFTAFQDPVEKKPFLLAKFLERRGVLPIYDGYNKEVPVDNHLTRIAIRTGIVNVDNYLLEKIATETEFSPEEDIILRYTVRLAYKIASQAGGVDPFIMDDFLWMFGRTCCTREAPSCKTFCNEKCNKMGGCQNKTCIFDNMCLARKNPLYLVPEHRFLNTWWY